MLDKRCGILLGIINNRCLGSGYKVIEIEELRLAMPKYLGETKESIIEHLSFLSSREYISIKYQDDTEVCLCPLTKGRLLTEIKEDEETERKKDKKAYFFHSFFGGLIGAVLGGIIGSVVMVILRLVGV